MSFFIRKVREEDLFDVFSLVKELAVFEKCSHEVVNTFEQFVKDKDFFECLVAESKHGEIIGVAVYFSGYHSPVGKFLHVNDLYVKEAFRRQKVGDALMKKIFEIAKNEDYKIVRLQVLRWNTSAIAFYKKHGAEFFDDCLTCEFDMKI